MNLSGNILEDRENDQSNNHRKYDLETKVIKNKNILCFGSENWEYPGFQQTTMRMLSSNNRIVYVNSLGTRKIKIDRIQAKFYLRKIRSLFKKTYNYSDNCVVYTPKIIPLIYNKYITILNRRLIKHQIKCLLDKHNFRSYILWVGSPVVAFFCDILKPELTVYHAVDRYSKFEFVNSAKIFEYEKIISKKADVILCTADAIRNDLIPFNESVHTVNHAVDYKHFYSAHNNGNVPVKIKNIKKPIIGYFGGLSERVNYDLLKKIANNYPDSSVVLIGKKYFDDSIFSKNRNVYTLGQIPYDDLPTYLKHFNVCLIPYHVNELTEGVDPIKLREYLCLGKPVVSVALPEVKKCKDLVYIAEDEEEFIIKIGSALNENDSMIVEKRKEYAEKNDWGMKIIEISSLINEKLKNKNFKNISNAIPPNIKR